MASSLPDILDRLVNILDSYAQSDAADELFDRWRHEFAGPAARGEASAGRFAAATLGAVALLLAPVKMPSDTSSLCGSCCLCSFCLGATGVDGTAGQVCCSGWGWSGKLAAEQPNHDDFSLRSTTTRATVILNLCATKPKVLATLVAADGAQDGLAALLGTLLVSLGKLVRLAPGAQGGSGSATAVAAATACGFLLPTTQAAVTLALRADAEAVRQSPDVAAVLEARSAACAWTPSPDTAALDPIMSQVLRLAQSTLIDDLVRDGAFAALGEWAQVGPPAVRARVQMSLASGSSDTLALERLWQSFDGLANDAVVTTLERRVRETAEETRLAGQEAATRGTGVATASLASALCQSLSNALTTTNEDVLRSSGGAAVDEAVVDRVVSLARTADSALVSAYKDAGDGGDDDTRSSDVLALAAQVLRAAPAVESGWRLAVEPPTVESVAVAAAAAAAAPADIWVKVLLPLVHQTLAAAVARGAGGVSGSRLDQEVVDLLREALVSVSEPLPVAPLFHAICDALAAGYAETERLPHHGANVLVGSLSDPQVPSLLLSAFTPAIARNALCRRAVFALAREATGLDTALYDEDTVGEGGVNLRPRLAAALAYFGDGHDHLFGDADTYRPPASVDEALPLSPTLIRSHALNARVSLQCEFFASVILGAPDFWRSPSAAPLVRQLVASATDYFVDPPPSAKADAASCLRAVRRGVDLRSLLVLLRALFTLPPLAGTETRLLSLALSTGLIDNAALASLLATVPPSTHLDAALVAKGREVGDVSLRVALAPWATVASLADDSAHVRAAAIAILAGKPALLAQVDTAAALMRAVAMPVRDEEDEEPGHSAQTSSDELHRVAAPALLSLALSRRHFLPAVLHALALGARLTARSDMLSTPAPQICAALSTLAKTLTAKDVEEVDSAVLRSLGKWEPAFAAWAGSGQSRRRSGSRRRGSADEARPSKPSPSPAASKKARAPAASATVDAAETAADQAALKATIARLVDEASSSSSATSSSLLPSAPGEGATEDEDTLSPLRASLTANPVRLDVTLTLLARHRMLQGGTVTLPPDVGSSLAEAVDAALTDASEDDALALLDEVLALVGDDGLPAPAANLARRRDAHIRRCLAAATSPHQWLRRHPAVVGYGGHASALELERAPAAPTGEVELDNIAPSEREPLLH